MYAYHNICVYIYIYIYVYICYNICIYMFVVCLLGGPCALLVCGSFLDSYKASCVQACIIACMHFLRKQCWFTMDLLCIWMWDMRPSI